MRLMCAALVLALPLMAQAQSYPNSANFGVEFDRGAPWVQACLRAEHAGPELTRPAGSMERCDASAAYYGKLDQASTSNAEWAYVHRCAVVANDTAVLSMLYANGLGVPRDIAAATRFACSTGAARAEMEGRVQHLATLAPGARYDQCDDITSGRMGGVCASIASSRAARINKAFVGRLRSSLPASQLAAFDLLLKTSQAFASAHAERETPEGGTGYSGFVIAAEARETEWLREHLLAFEKGVFKVPAPAQFASADYELNRVYGLSMKSQEIPPAEIRYTQRSWLAYRDAWVAFAALRYPQLPEESLKALLTEWRTKQLPRI